MEKRVWMSYLVIAVLWLIPLLLVAFSGKTRGKVLVPAGSDNDQTASIAITAMSKYIGDKAIRRTIVVPGRLINIVI